MRTRTLVRSSGLDLAVETFGAGPPLVFAHGLSSNRHMTRRHLEELADSYRIVIFDQRGHGESPSVVDPACYDPELMAADMAAVLDALDIERAYVGGESMGAATALTFALRWPERVRALMLTGPAFGDAPNPERPRIVEMADAIEALGLDGYLAASSEAMRGRGVPERMIELVNEMQRSHDPASLATACRSVMGWVLLPDLSPLERLAMPTCIIAWEGDPLHPAELARRYAERMPHVRLEYIGSVAELFSNPHQIGRIYGDFLARL